LMAAGSMEVEPKGRSIQSCTVVTEPRVTLMEVMCRGQVANEGRD